MKPMLKIQLNGQPREIENVISVAGLIEDLGISGKRVAVELNQEILPKSLHAETLLAEGDIVEIVGAIGGG